ncbi:uncharacterized protein BJ212DRAFT_1367829 [Suillus subaureus]|uniref:Uncharacterized protein n=1 Tax=Suillus subaureus TaxID=48587 RepID=A0A9P7JBU2_9AGAM|nr:uncharacterized protein BJ212DRAFT_1367829 [Suillus subaureus]KAG1813324.1 hypothetical protein BJ212DRAFT_1367829 [Suillus subaureus]
MSDAVSIRSTRSAPPSYSVALRHSIQEEEEPPRVVPEAPLVVLAPPTNLSTDTLVEATARGPFTFSPFGPNSMLLLPHALSSNSRPLYHISVSNDCFRPQIYTTTIRRGTEQDGPYYTMMDIAGLLNTEGQCGLRWLILTMYIFKGETAKW